MIFETTKDISILEPFFFTWSLPTIHSVNPSNTPECNEGEVLKPLAGLASPERITDKPKERYFSPKQTNKLFWCIYAKIHGIEDYESIKHGFSNVETRERTQIMNYFKDHSYLISNSNIKITQVLFKELMSELLSSVKTSVLSLYIYALYYKINIYLVNIDKHIYAEFLSCSPSLQSGEFKEFSEQRVGEGEEKYIIIYFKDSPERSVCESNFSGENEGKTRVDGDGDKVTPLVRSSESVKFTKYWCIFRDSSEDEFYLSKIKKDFFKIDNVLKPLKGISQYKVSELEELYEGLRRSEAEVKPYLPELAKENASNESSQKNCKNKMKKQDMYNKILEIVKILE